MYSISKTFTAVLGLKAVKNKISLKQVIIKYFPTILNVKRITIEDLLYHRSGNHDFTENADYLTWNTQLKNSKQILEVIASAGSVFKPGKKSNKVIPTTYYYVYP